MESCEECEEFVFLILNSKVEYYKNEHIQISEIKTIKQILKKFIKISLNCTLNHKNVNQNESSSKQNKIYDEGLAKFNSSIKYQYLWNSIKKSSKLTYYFSQSETRILSLADYFQFQILKTPFFIPETVSQSSDKTTLMIAKIDENNLASYDTMFLVRKE